MVQAHRALGLPYELTLTLRGIERKRKKKEEFELYVCVYVIFRFEAACSSMLAIAIEEYRSMQGITSLEL